MSSENHHYCKNLMEVNKSNRVIASQAIYNEQGVLLLAEGSEISEKRAEILLHHKLMKPLEQSIGIANSFDAKQLVEYLNKFAANIPGLAVVTQEDQYQKALVQCSLYYAKFPLLQLNLTVLAARAPSIYFQGLFSAMAGLAIGLQLKLPPKELLTVFIAGLFHDIGFLYLPSDLAEKTTEFSNNEWKALQAHPLIAQRFLSLIPELPKDVGQAICHHHERIDGTGYPHHIFGDKLTLASQIIAATDNIILNYGRYSNYLEHTHSILLLALKLSDNIYLESVFDAAMVLFKKAPPPVTKLNHFPSLGELLDKQKRLQIQFENTKNLSQKLMAQVKDPIIRSVAAAMGRLAISVVRSGILHPGQEEWLGKTVSDNSTSDAMPLIEVSVMHDQIYDQLLHLKNLMARAIERIPDNTPDLRDSASSSLLSIDL